jgi:dihydroflavonol-4-reductase
MKIAITGASGHVGANLTRVLLKQDHRIKVLVNQYSGSLPEGPERIPGNLLDPGSLNDLAAGCEILIHLAAGISIDGNSNIIDTNVEGTRNVIRASVDAKIRRLIHFSSIHALVHEPLDSPLDETRPLALNDRIIYNRSKAQAEQLVLDAVGRGLDAVIINPTSVMGPNDFKPSLVGQAVLQMCQGRLPALIPGGYDWVDVRDVVDGTLTAIEKGRKGENYLLSGHYVSLKDFYDILLEIQGGGKQLRLLPFWLAHLGVPFLKAWARMTGRSPLYTRESLDILKTAHKAISSEKAVKELDYHPRPFEETLRDTVGWFKENHYL